MKKIWSKSLPSIYNTWFHGALLQENNYLKYYFFYPSNIFPISDITFDIDSGEIINCNQNIDDVQKKRNATTQENLRNITARTILFLESIA